MVVEGGPLTARTARPEHFDWEGERPRFAISARFEPIRVRHGGELPAAQVTRENFFGDG